MWRGRFAFEVRGKSARRLEMAGSEWHLFQAMRRIAAAGEEFSWFTSAGAPLTPRSLGALNSYLRSGALRFWKSSRVDQGRELIGRPEWARFCRMLNLRFDGGGTRQAAA